jgi:PAP2 superfamily
MTAAAAASIATRATGPLSRWLSVRHPLHTEAAAVIALYGLYEVARGLVVGNAAEAERHARRITATERPLHLLLETKLQSAVHVLPGLTSLLAAAYLTLHLTVTAAVLLWLHQRRPAAFPFVRTTLLLGPIDLNHGLVSSLYNPYAAVPSMHIGYALVVALTLLRHGQRSVVRVLGALYPPFVLLVIVATGNHFFFDAAAGAITVALAAASARVVTRRPRNAHLARLPEQPLRAPRPERLAA